MSRRRRLFVVEMWRCVNIEGSRYQSGQELIHSTRDIGTFRRKRQMHFNPIVSGGLASSRTITVPNFGSRSGLATHLLEHAPSGAFSLRCI
jgi:hypothetical protein